jgi:hypothetical protein
LLPLHIDGSIDQENETPQAQKVWTVTPAKKKSKTKERSFVFCFGLGKS